MTRLFYVLVLCICAVSCGREYTAEEQQFISEINDIIQSITASPLSQEGLDDKFFASGKPLENAQIVFLGEDHVDEAILLDQARALELMLKPGDVILFEGNNAGEAVDCDRRIFSLYVVKKWNETKRKYDPKAFDHFAAERYPLWAYTQEELSLEKLKLHNAKCYYWDSLSAFDVQPNLDSLNQRNAAMVGEISRHLSGTGRVFVRAGAFHLPSYDLVRFKDHFTKSSFFAQKWYNLSERKLNLLNLTTYYPQLKLGTSLDAIEGREKDGYGSTQVIHDFIKDRNYVELIPRTLIKKAQPCGDTCQ